MRVHEFLRRDLLWLWLAQHPNQEMAPSASQTLLLQGPCFLTPLRLRVFRAQQAFVLHFSQTRRHEDELVEDDLATEVVSALPALKQLPGPACERKLRAARLGVERRRQ